MSDTIEVGHESVSRVVQINSDPSDKAPSAEIILDTSSAGRDVHVPRSLAPVATVNNPSVRFNEPRALPTRPSAPSPAALPMPRFAAPAPAPPPVFNDSSFLDMANMTKVRHEVDDDASSVEFSSPTVRPQPSGHTQPVQTTFSAPLAPPPVAAVHDYMVPREPFKSIQDEKGDILNKLFHMKKKGLYHPPRAFSMDSDIRELRAEIDQIIHCAQMENGVKLARKILIAVVTGIEFLNKRFDPFHIQLEGWSESVMENIGDYDNVFEKLIEKYSGRGSTPPEIELLLALAGSAMMFHLTKNIFKATGGLPGVGDVLKNNPNFLQSIMKSMQPPPTTMVPPVPTPVPVAPPHQSMDDGASDASTEVGDMPRAMRGPDFARLGLPKNTLPPMHSNRGIADDLEEEIESLAGTMSEGNFSEDNMSALTGDFSDLVSDRGEYGKRGSDTRQVKILPNKRAAAKKRPLRR